MGAAMVLPRVEVMPSPQLLPLPTSPCFARGLQAALPQIVHFKLSRRLEHPPRWVVMAACVS